MQSVILRAGQVDYADISWRGRDDGLADARRQEAQDMSCDRLGMFFRGEVPRGDKVNFRVRNVAFECLRPGGNEEGIVLAPHCQHRRLDLTQGLVPLWILRDVVLVVVDKRELYLRIPQTIECHLVEGITIRA